MDSFSTLIESSSLVPIDTELDVLRALCIGNASLPEAQHESTSPVPVNSEAIGAGDATAFCVIS
ncbi:pheromone precursor [Lentinula edodes]|uniref:Pheromone n=1 Tax=Lentinula edodes TaxID=5353 RepID=B9UN17_LENED|nr:pheromone precursor [Lentinula edodes]AGC14681.1 pheromone precursor [Lentinula edodes]AGC14706.1 pheromone precursor [Lentinula edodes]AGL07724.1 pheromone precursor [Lentinula edodes]AGL08106.1 pheromone precursor [Lentinula edodes]